MTSNFSHEKSAKSGSVQHAVTPPTTPALVETLLYFDVLISWTVMHIGFTLKKIQSPRTLKVRSHTTCHQNIL